MSSVNEVKVNSPAAAALVKSTGKPGRDGLKGFPLLVHAPAQWGRGVRTEDKGVLVSDIAIKASEVPDRAALASLFGTTESHVDQALKYAEKVSSQAAT